MIAIDEALKFLQDEIDILKLRLVLSDDAIGHLCDIYQIAFIESSYDPLNKRSQETAQMIYPHIKALNSELKFKK